MNSYLFEKIGQTRREALVDDAAAYRFAKDLAPVSSGGANRAHEGVLASLRRLLSGPDGSEASFLPRLSDYPTARH